MAAKTEQQRRQSRAASRRRRRKQNRRVLTVLLWLIIVVGVLLWVRFCREPSVDRAESSAESTGTTAAVASVSETDGRTLTANGYPVEEKDGITYVDGVMVANKTYSLPASYHPGELTAECADAFASLQQAAAAEGLNLYIASGFRSYEDQEIIYNNYVEYDGQEEADRYSARPGYSEHQTGLAIDLNSVDDSFGDTAEGQWVAAHAHEYGFILRYPQEKEAQTGYLYEPWHIRYVGTETAAAIYASGLCLEEYYGITSAYGN